MRRNPAPVTLTVYPHPAAFMHHDPSNSSPSPAADRREVISTAAHVAVTRRIDESHSTMSFGDHLEELRRRLIFALLGLAPILIVGIIIGKPLLEFLMRPAKDTLVQAGLSGQLLTTGFIEGFAAYFKVTVLFTLILGAPWILYQLWRFIAPGLYAHERRFGYILIPLSGLLSILGVAFLYYVMMPAMLLFLINFSAGLGRETAGTAPLPAGLSTPAIPVLEKDPPLEQLQPGQLWINTATNELRTAFAVGQATTTNPDAPPTLHYYSIPLTKSSGILQQYKLSEYMSLFYGMGLAFAIGFQTPAVVLLLGWLGIVDGSFLRSKRRHAVLVCAAVAAVLTPSPDPFSMLLLAIPLFLLYELGILFLRILPASRITGSSSRREPNDGEP